MNNKKKPNNNDTNNSNTNENHGRTHKNNIDKKMRSCFFKITSFKKKLSSAFRATRPVVNFINCFAPYTDLLHPKPNFYSAKASKMLNIVRKQFGIWHETVYEIDPGIS